MANRSKLYKKQFESFVRANRYPIAEAIKLLQGMPHVKFDETVELAFKLGIDPKQTDQTVRGAVPLPKGTGKKVTIAVVADDEKLKNEAKAAGADYVGFDELIAKIKEGWTEFDVLIATPSAMSQVRPLGRQLGPKGLMPNPKTGTVTEKVGAAVAEAKAGRVEYRADKGACVHVPVGKLSFKVEDLSENCVAVIKAVIKAKPSSAKGVYIQNCTISSTMSPGIKLDTRELVKENA